MKKTNKPLFTFLNIVVAVLIVVAFSTAFALNASAEGETSHIIAEGDCGWDAAASIIDSNLHWTLSSKGTVVVSGSGEMIPMFSFHPIWDDCIDPETTGQPPVPVKIVVIEPGATNISHCAFSYAVDMTTIVIPSSVTSIGTYAFEACDALKSVFYTGTEEQWAQIENVEEIEAFENVTIRCNIVEWGFCGNTKIGFTDYSGDSSNLLWTQDTDGQAVVSGEGEMGTGGMDMSPVKTSRPVTSAIVEAAIEDLPYCAFSGCSSMTSIVLPEGLKTIWEYSLEHCYALTTITIPASVTKIQQRAFSVDYMLTDVYYGGSREQWKQIDIDSDNPFNNSPYGTERINIHFADETDNITWTLEDGVLTISGTGAIRPTVEKVESISESWNSETQTWQTSSGFYYDLHYPWDPDEAMIKELLGGIPLDVFGRVVKKIVVEEGITEINGSAFQFFMPETVVLPSTLRRVAAHRDAASSSALFEPFFLKDLYIGNPDAVFRPDSNRFFDDGYYIELHGSAIGNLFESFDALRNFFTSYYKNYMEFMQSPSIIYWGEGLYVLQTIFEARHHAVISMSDSYYVNDDALDTFISGRLRHDADTWEYAGIRYDTYEHFEADLIAKLNEMIGSSFSSVEDLFVLKPAETEGERPTAEYSEALTEAVSSLYEEYVEFKESVDKMDAFAERYALGGEPVARIQTGWNQETQAMDYDYLPLTAYPWITVHGYAGSAAETAAAASGVKFAPLCPTDYTHTVTDKAEIAATCTTAGTEAGWYCEDCGVYLTGGETIPATNHPNAYETPATEATATEHGHTAGVYCPDCNDWISGHDVIHNILGPYYPVEEAPDFDPDELIAYSEDGDYIIYCSVCNEPGLYKLEVGTPDEPGDSGSGNIFTRVIEAIRNAFGGVVNFFLRLIKWLGGK